MGHYLSHVNNARSDASANTFPDENYAREVMQLFSIGLFELNPDGTQRRGPDGQPIPTYSNADIREYAKIFTGLTWAPEFDGEAPSSSDEAVYGAHDGRGLHEPGQSACSAAPSAAAAAVWGVRADSCSGTNAGPFISRLLIQRLVTSTVAGLRRARRTGLRR